MFGFGLEMLSIADELGKMNKHITKTIFKDGSTFPGDCIACGAELNAHGVPIYGTKFWQKEQPKMTREEALRILDDAKWSDSKRFLTMLEALGLLKFEEEKKIAKFEINNMGIIDWCGLEEACAMTNQYGTIRLEEWPEGLVLWVGGEIKWKSWEKYYKKGDVVTVSNHYGGRVVGPIVK